MSRHVMVVDDEEKVRKYLTRLIKNRGFEVEAAADGHAALERLNEKDFDLVILDVLMPGLDGIEVLQQIKKLKPLTEVIMLTGKASVETGIEGMRLGAFDYLLKPVDLEGLYLCLQEAMEQKKFREEGG